MLMTNDIGNLFAAMRAIYGNQWKHGQEAMVIWLDALKTADPEDLAAALRQSVIDHPDYPPTLPQFLHLAMGSQKRVSTYLPPPEFDQANADKAWDHMEKLAGRRLRPE